MSNRYRTLKTEAETDPETSVDLNHLTQLSAGDFTEEHVELFHPFFKRVCIFVLHEAW
jgi:hypothetical protein